MGPFNLFILWFNVLIISLLVYKSEQLLLKQVVILSRHNVRTPLSKILTQSSPKPWPKWDEKPGYLTSKGVLLEGYMGKYFCSWLNEENLLPSGCPTEKDFFVYANTAQRTLASAKSFVSNAFPLCNITIHHATNVDPIFNPVIHNSSSFFIEEAMRIMQDNINDLHLNHSLYVLEEILDYKGSQNCLKNHHCDLATDKNTAVVSTGTKPNVVGPLKISNGAVDSFIMEYYEAFKMTDVAWGLLNSDEKWKSILEISRKYHNIIFNTTLIAKDISKPLLKYMTDIFLSKTAPKVTLLMGHDANIFTILSAMGFKPYTLKNQHEIAPIGGKIVFQRWSDNNTKDFLKIDYIYQPSKDMRDGKRLSMVNPPLFEQLELNNCVVDMNGLCPWADFEMLLKKLCNIVS